MRTCFRFFLVSLGFALCLINTMKGNGDTRLSKAEFERLWQTATEVVGTVRAYNQGKGDALTFEYDGHLSLCSDDVAIIDVTSSDEKISRELRVSVDRAGLHGSALLKKVGTKVKFKIPLLYMKYNPWGFVPSDDLKEIIEVVPSQR